MGPTRANSRICGRPMGHPALTAFTVGLAICLSPLLVERPAAAQEFRFHAEPAAAFWADKPQSDRWGPGFYHGLRPSITLGRYVSLQATYAMLLTSRGEDIDEGGAAHFVLGGVRFRPLAFVSPERDLAGLFVDGNLGYVRTGDEDRLGFDAGLGYNFHVKPWLAVGPVVRYVHIVQPDGVANTNPHDAQLIIAGVNFTFGPAHREEVTEPECPAAPDCPEQTVVYVTADANEEVAEAPTRRELRREPERAPDRDRDGVSDADDRCPTEIGPPPTFGCPIDPCSGDPLLVLVQFPYDSAALPLPREDDPQTMDPVLDAVAAAIAQDPSCRVCIMGHASEEGPADYNVTLSSQRAEAVSGYMTARGLADRKMPTTGMGAACQLEPEASRPANRRVSFIRLQEGESCPATCPE